MAQYKRGPSAVIFLIVGVTLLLGALSMVGLAIMFTVRGGELPPAGKGVFEGVVLKGKTVDAPLAEPVLFGHVQVYGISAGAKGDRWTTLYEKRLGKARVRLKAGSKKRSITLPSYSSQAWKGCVGTYTRRRSLKGTPLQKTVGRKTSKYREVQVSVYGVRTGDELIVETGGDKRAERIWCGDRETIAARETAYAEQGVIMFGAAGGGLLFVSLLLIAAHFVLAKRRKRSLPQPDDDPAKSVLWALRQRSAHWKGPWHERTLVGQRAYRKYGQGPAMVRLSTDIASKLTLIRRGGVAAAVGGAIDRLASSEPVPGEQLGYPGVEIAMSDNAWGNAVLERPETREAVGKLLKADAGSSIVNISLRPGYVSLTLPYADPSNVGAESVGLWLHALESLARTAESAPPPAEQVEPGWADRMAMDPARASAFAMKLVLGLVAVMVLAMGLVVAVVLAL